MFASLGMYPFDAVLPAYEDLWGLLTARVGWLPAELSPLDEDRWDDPELALSQTCGWPLVTTLAGRVRPIGSFHLTVGSADGWRYRSLIVGTNPVPGTGLTAAVNANDSMSGWVSLLRYAGVEDWPGEVLWTGSHTESCAAVADGLADTSAIDSLSMAFLNREGRYLDLPVVGQGPIIPSLPLITSAATSDNQLAELRSALTAIVDDPANADLMANLMIRGFSPLDAEDYTAAIKP